MYMKRGNYFNFEHQNNFKILSSACGEFSRNQTTIEIIKHKMCISRLWLLELLQYIVYNCMQVYYSDFRFAKFADK